MSAVTPLAPQRAARIATQLIELIEIQNLKPNDRLPSERTLAELLEVSRPSLREALHILQAQGLVLIKHGQGTFVQEPIVAQELRASMLANTHGLNELFTFPSFTSLANKNVWIIGVNIAIIASLES